MLHSPELCR